MKKGEEIVGYGSTISATTPVYSLELGQYLKAFIEDDPYRQGLESPGSARPTVDNAQSFSEAGNTIY